MRRATLTALTRTPPVRTSSGHEAGAVPSPTGRTAPISARTMEWQNASARTFAATMPSGPRVQDSSSSVRTVVAPSRRRQKAAKSCARAAVREPALHARPRRAAGRTPGLTPAERVRALRGVGHAVDVPAPQRRRSARRTRTGRARGDAPVRPPAAARTPAAAPRRSDHRPDRLGQVEVGHLARARGRRRRSGRPPSAAGRSDIRSATARACSSTPSTVRRPGWRRPAEEVRAVIGEVEADSHDGIEPAAPCGVGGLGCVGHGG